MKELVKIENWSFDNYYEGTNGTKKVICILDDYCVRYHVKVNGKETSRKEFTNDKKELCFKNATKALNKSRKG